MEFTPKPAGNSYEEIQKWRKENKDNLAALRVDKTFVETSGHNMIPVEEMTADEREAIQEKLKDDNNAA